MVANFPNFPDGNLRPRHSHFQKVRSDSMDIGRRFLFRSKGLQDIAQFDNLMTVGSHHGTRHERNGRRRPQSTVMSRSVFFVIGMNNPHNVLKFLGPSIAGGTVPVAVFGFFQNTNVGRGCCCDDFGGSTVAFIIIFILGSLLLVIRNNEPTDISHGKNRSQSRMIPCRIKQEFETRLGIRHIRHAGVFRQPPSNVCFLRWFIVKDLSVQFQLIFFQFQPGNDQCDPLMIVGCWFFWLL